VGTGADKQEEIGVGFETRDKGEKYIESSFWARDARRFRSFKDMFESLVLLRGEESIKWLNCSKTDFRFGGAGFYA
jgi:hypothetical protein